MTDPATFASLALVNRKWRAASESPHLYAHHLSRCPSFSINNTVVPGPFDDNSLPRLKRLFVQEVKRNLFEPYLRPRRTAIKLISTTYSSAAAFPGGEAFDFIFSPNGHWTLALCSSRIYLLDTVSPRVSVQREFKVLRRPVSAAILDDGSILAVLSSVHQVNVYDLSSLKLRHLRAIALDNPPNNIALSPKGEVMAAAYEGGIEVHSLAGAALSTDRRAVKCDSVDSIEFSSDGTMLLGTTQNSKNPNTVILSAPYYSEADQGLPSTALLSQMWTSQILFPNSSRDCSHAALLAHHTEGDASWTFTYDRVFESFRAVRTDDLRNGTTYFTGPQIPSTAGPRSARRKLIPCTLPSTSDRGELVAAGFLGKEVWLYGVPESLDTSPVSQTDDSRAQGVLTSGPSFSLTNEIDPRSPESSLTSGEAAELMRLPQWQVLVDKYRNVFAKGRCVAQLSGVSSVRWVSRRHESLGSRSVAQRLIITAPGGVSGPSGQEEDEFAIVDGGRLLILDFDRTTEDGKCEEINFEVGNNAPELLEEEDIDMDTEVALVRQRTVRQRKDGPARSSFVADVLAPVPDLPTHHPPTLAFRPSSSSADTERNLMEDADPQQRPSPLVPTPIEGLSLEEASAVFDGPYSHTQPRSRTSLYRSATAVAANRQRNPSRIMPEGRTEYRRADGRGELPHESDADNWVPPPPPYTPDADKPLPEHLKLSLLPRATEPLRQVATELPLCHRANTITGSLSRSSPSRRTSSLPDGSFFSWSRNATASSSSITEIDETSRDRFPPSEGTRPIMSLNLSQGQIRASPSAASVSPSRRPTSTYVGRYSSCNQRRPIANRIIIPFPPIQEPHTPRRRNVGYPQSLSLPSSPIGSEDDSAVSNLTHSGANLQQRLDYPLPPAPNRILTSPPSSPFAAGGETPTRAPNHTQEIDMIAASMPSAQQLANLQSRYSQHSPPVSASPVRHPQLTNIISAPPRGALGAAGSPAWSADRRRLSIACRSSFAASSPALLRPAPRRLDTIQSVSEIVEEGRARSMDIGSEGLTMRGDRRSTSLGPVEVGREGKKGWWRRKRVEREWDQSEMEKGGRCVLM